MHSRSARRPGALIPLLVGLLAAAGLAGCGLIGSGGLETVTRLRVSAFYGTRLLVTGAFVHQPMGLSALELLRRFTRVRVAGERITAVDGVPAGPHQRWSLYVNGVLAVRPPALTAVSQGDQVRVDLQSTLTGSAPAAIVGDYPQPFANGRGGKRFPAVLSCAPGNGEACTTVGRVLGQAGVKVAYQGIGTGSGSDSLAVLVGTFTQLRGVLADVLLTDGPRISGVYAQTSLHPGGPLELEDPAGDAAGTLGGDVGLVAATEQSGLNEPVWLISGRTPTGVRLAAGALNRATLSDRYAVAVLPGGRSLALPRDPVPGGRQTG